MDQLIGFVLDALAEKNANASVTGQPPGAETAQERYERVLAELRARAVGPPYPGAAPVLPPRAAAPPSPPAAAAPRPAASPPATAPIPAQRGPLHGLFEGGNSLIRAVVAAELLDRPLALRENMRWQKP